MGTQGMVVVQDYDGSVLVVLEAGTDGGPWGLGRDVAQFVSCASVAWHAVDNASRGVTGLAADLLACLLGGRGRSWHMLDPDGWAHDYDPNYAYVVRLDDLSARDFREVKEDMEHDKHGLDWRGRLHVAVYGWEQRVLWHGAGVDMPAAMERIRKRITAG